LKPSNASRKLPVSEPANNLGLRIVREGALIGLVAVCGYLLLAMFSYDVADGGWSSTGENTQIANLGGRFGAWLADIFFSFFGYLAYLFPVMLAYRIVLVFRDRTPQAPRVADGKYSRGRFDFGHGRRHWYSGHALQRRRIGAALFKRRIAWQWRRFAGG
jgi:hypothetical protein